MDFFKFKNDLNPEKGRLLISEPFLPDPNFERTVVLLCEHNEDGSFGFILNKPSAVNLDDIIENINDFQETVHIGGPVQQDTLHFIHKADYLEGGVDLGNGLFWGGDYGQLLELIDSKMIKPIDFKLFVCYSGWSEGQLDEELDANSWIVTQNATAEFVFDLVSVALWNRVLYGLGGRYNVYSNYPTDPRLN